MVAGMGACDAAGGQQSKDPGDVGQDPVGDPDLSCQLPGGLELCGRAVRVGHWNQPRKIQGSDALDGFLCGHLCRRICLCAGSGVRHFADGGGVGDPDPSAVQRAEREESEGQSGDEVDVLPVLSASSGCDRALAMDTVKLQGISNNSTCGERREDFSSV